jgi:hypothetical protein
VSGRRGTGILAASFAVSLFGCTLADERVDAPSMAATRATGADVRTPATTTTGGRCFGDSPPETVVQDARPKDLFATGNDLLWRSGGVLHRQDLATARTSTFDASEWVTVNAADSSDAFGAGPQLDIVAMNLTTGRPRLLSASTAWSASTLRSGVRPGAETLRGAEYLLDGDYLYVAWVPDTSLYNPSIGMAALRVVQGPHDIGVLSRLKRDGSGPPEFIGMGPDGHFVLHDGYAYYGTHWEGLKRRSLVRGPAREVLWSEPRVPDVWAIGVAAGRVYFGRDAYPELRAKYAIASIAVPAPSIGDAGGAPAEARVDVLSWDASFKGGILDGKCVYGGDPRGVTRANLEDGTVQKLIEGYPPPDPALYHGHMMASDGRYLYWADSGGDRIVRWSR